MTLHHNFRVRGEGFRAVVSRTDVEIGWDETGNPNEFLWNWKLYQDDNQLAIGTEASCGLATREAETKARKIVEAYRVKQTA